MSKITPDYKRDHATKGKVPEKPRMEKKLKEKESNKDK